jgi:antirestriction protein ArdC
VSDAPAERDERRRRQLTELHTRLAHAVEDLAHGDAWRRMLDMAARLPTYSANNVLLITVQRPDATRVAGYQAWRAMGRHVRKGETGIAILAPCLYREPAAETATTAGPSPVARDAVAGTSQVLRGFRVAHVFDITQTDGPDLPRDPQLLVGHSPADLWTRLSALVASDGFVLERGPCGTANGYTSFETATIRIRDDVDDLHAVKTLAHEIGHVRADHRTRFADTYHRSAGCRGVAEVEAESIAHIVLGAVGVDTGGYSLPYIAGWSDGDTSLLRATADRVISVAGRVLREMEPARTDGALTIGASELPTSPRATVIDGLTR